MAGLERLRLKAKRTEASALLPVASVELLESLDADAAWWICHDEEALDAMLSLVVVRNDVWKVERVRLQGAPGSDAADAEALARRGQQIFVFGSSFVDKRGAIDPSRAFVARFTEPTDRLTAAVDVLEVATLWSELLSRAAPDGSLLETDRDALVNVEGACVVGDDLLLGLRWPVSATGQPLVMRVVGAAIELSRPDWHPTALADLPVHLLHVDAEGSAKRPVGVRGMTAVGTAVHVLTGQTERGLAKKKVKAGAAQHVELVGSVAEGISSTTVVERFEGFRKVEGLAPIPSGGWLYALDDEDAVVLLTSGA